VARSNKRIIVIVGRGSKAEILDPGKGDQIGKMFAGWSIVYFGQII
jgi:hypothetical protein